MSVQNQIVKNVYAGNGSTTVFPFTFALNTSDGEYVKVYIADETEVSEETTNFTIDTTVKTVTYPATGDPLPSGYKIIIRRELPNEQDLNLENNGAFFAEDIESTFDREVMMIQQLAEQLDRAVKVDMSSVTTPDELIAELRTKSAEAVASAAAAKTSEDNAAASATSAGTSATNAATSATAASNSATNAATSETNAGTSATNAAASATSAINSATAAATSETNAATSANSASTSATNAVTSATNAATSATAASESATSAANSAELASTFAHRLPVGTIYAYAGNGENPIGALLCDGSAVSRTMYPDLFAKIGTTYGAGDGSTTFNLPNLSDNRFVEGSTTAGNMIAAGLPNITGSFACDNSGSRLSGAFSMEAGLPTTVGLEGSSSNNTANMVFDASQSNSIYGNSDTVQPKSLTLRYFIQAFDGQTPDSALIDITQYAQELATKANRDLSNLTQTGQDSFLERDFTIIYPNGGSEASPANVTSNSRYVETNPFSGYYVHCVVEVLFNNEWGCPSFYADAYGGGNRGVFTVAFQLDDNNIIVQTGSVGVMLGMSNVCGCPFNVNVDKFYASLPCRVKVWKIGKKP